MASNYTSDNIKEKTILDWILLRPELHGGGDLGLQAIYKYIKEIIDNATDEVFEPASCADTAEIHLFIDEKKNTFQVAVRDNGRGIPVDILERTFTHAFNSGKYDDDSYGTSNGSIGIGSKSTVAMSEHFRVISKRDGKLGSLTTEACMNGNNKSVQIVESKVVKYKSDTTGTFVVFEPRKNFFKDVDVFISEGYKQIVNLCYLLTMFNDKANIIVTKVDKPLDKDFWTLSPAEAVEHISDRYERYSDVIVDGANPEASMQYLKELWNLDPNSNFKWELTNIEHPYNGNIGYIVNIYLPTTLRGSNVISLINSAPMKDTNSSQNTTILNTIKKKISGYIEEDDYREYFDTIYKLPVCVSMSVQYSNKKLRYSSLAKDSFKDESFERDFEKMLLKDFKEIDDHAWKQLYTFIADDIKTKYNVYYNKPQTSRKENKKLLNEIRTEYKDCSTANRKEAELYIVEGLSAKHIIEKRDPATQAVYLIYGKPTNVLRNSNGKISSIDIFRKYPAYSDLEKILNIHPKQEDLSTASFGKIILTNDADIDGGHIRSLHLGALHALNPRIITSGMVYLANPPLYEVTISEKDKKEKHKYIQDKPSLIEFFIECLYKNTLDIFIGDKRHFRTPQKLEGRAYSDFCSIITAIGEIFDELHGRLAIHPFILEKLTYLTPYLTPNGFNINELKKAFGKSLEYNAKLNILTIEMENEDISFPIDGVVDALYEELIPYLHRIGWKYIEIYASTKFSDALNMNRISITQLYQCFKNLNSKLHTVRHKGLGSINIENLAPLCLYKDTRILHQITSIGEYNTIQALLGDDVAVRKSILQSKGVI